MECAALLSLRLLHPQEDDVGISPIPRGSTDSIPFGNNNVELGGSDAPVPRDTPTVTALGRALVKVKVVAPTAEWSQDSVNPVKYANESLSTLSRPV